MINKRRLIFLTFQLSLVCLLFLKNSYAYNITDAVSINSELKISESFNDNLLLDEKKHDSGFTSDASSYITIISDISKNPKIFINDNLNFKWLPKNRNHIRYFNTHFLRAEAEQNLFNEKVKILVKNLFSQEPINTDFNLHNNIVNTQLNNIDKQVIQNNNILTNINRFSVNLSLLLTYLQANYSFSETSYDDNELSDSKNHSISTLFTKPFGRWNAGVKLNHSVNIQERGKLEIDNAKNQQLIRLRDILKNDIINREYGAGLSISGQLYRRWLTDFQYNHSLNKIENTINCGTIIPAGACMSTGVIKEEKINKDDFKILNKWALTANLNIGASIGYVITRQDNIENGQNNITESANISWQQSRYIIWMADAANQVNIANTGEIFRNRTVQMAHKYQDKNKTFQAQIFFKQDKTKQDMGLVKGYSINGGYDITEKSNIYIYNSASQTMFDEQDTRTTDIYSETGYTLKLYKWLHCSMQYKHRTFSDDKRGNTKYYRNNIYMVTLSGFLL